MNLIINILLSSIENCMLSRFRSGMVEFFSLCWNMIWLCDSFWIWVMLMKFWFIILVMEMVRVWMMKGVILIVSINVGRMV